MSVQPVKRKRGEKEEVENVEAIRQENIFATYCEPSMFMFYVGSKGRALAMHLALLKQLSPVLKTLVSGSMIEAQEGYVNWPDVNEETFALFAQWAYIGRYTVEKAHQYADYSKFSDKTESCPHSTTSLALAHARLNCFAHCYGLDKLCLASLNAFKFQLSWDKNGCGLSKSCNHPQRTLTTIAQFCFAEDSAANDTLGAEAMSVLAKNSHLVASHPPFESLLEAHPELALTLCKALLGK